MIKKVVAVVLIVLTGGGWLYVDYLNRQQIMEAAELRRSIEQARAQVLAHAKALAEAKAKFEAQMLADLTGCKAAAEKAKEEFLAQNQKPVRRRPGKFTIPQAAVDEATKTLEAANAVCQATYDMRVKNGS